MLGPCFVCSFVIFIFHTRKWKREADETELRTGLRALTQTEDLPNDRIRSVPSLKRVPSDASQREQNICLSAVACYADFFSFPLLYYPRVVEHIVCGSRIFKLCSRTNGFLFPWLITSSRTSHKRCGIVLTTDTSEHSNKRGCIPFFRPIPSSVLIHSTMRCVGNLVSARRGGVSL